MGPGGGMEWRPGTAAFPGLGAHDAFGTTHNFGMHGPAEAGPLPPSLTLGAGLRDAWNLWPSRKSTS